MARTAVRRRATKAPIAHESTKTALKVEQWPIGRLVEYERNPRKNDTVVDQMAAAIREFGFRTPIVAKSDGLVIDGHLRLKAARKLGLTEVPVALADELTDAQIKAFRLLANRSANWAEWDNDLLRVELGDLKAFGFPLELTGFSMPEIGAIFADKTDGLTDPDDAPEPPADPVSRLGDVWLLGGHRLVCGDSTKAADVAKALGGAKPHLMVTDPPYGVSYDPDWRNRADRANGKPYGASAVGLVQNDDRSDWSGAYRLFRGDVAYVWAPGGPTQFEFYRTLVESGLCVRAQLIWAKQQFPIGRGNYHVQHEPCLYAVRKGQTAHWDGGRKQTTLWRIDKPHKSETGHSTQKPIECMKRPIENNSQPGDAVYEPFSGSGTTIIAGEMAGRKVHAIEISPIYVDVAVTRWQNFTGKQATLEATSETFAQTKITRASTSSGSATSATKTAKHSNAVDGAPAPT